MLVPESAGARLLGFCYAFSGRLLHPAGLIRMHSAFMGTGLKGLAEAMNIRGEGNLIWNHFASNCKIQRLYLSKKFFALAFIVDLNNILT